MTTFDLLESSVESSRPIELFKITLGSQIYRYTSSEDTITVAGQDYVPEAISRSAVEQGSDSSDRTITISLPSDNSFASLYINIVPGERAEVDIYRYQRDEVPTLATQVLLFKGTVQSVKFPNDGSFADISVRSIETALNRTVPKFTYMSMCNHILYDANCGANPASFSHTGLVSVESGADITVVGLAASGHSFAGGFVRPVGTVDFRVVLAQSGDILTLMLPFAEPVLGSDVVAFAGCNHLAEGHCSTVFDNVANFGGFPFVPTRNVFQSGLDG